MALTAWSSYGLAMHVLTRRQWLDSESRSHERLLREAEPNAPEWLVQKSLGELRQLAVKHWAWMLKARTILTAFQWLILLAALTNNQV